MTRAATVTRFVSYVDDLRVPLRLSLSPDQEVVAQDEPVASGANRVRRFLFVRGPANRPIHLVRQERLTEGSLMWVRYTPEVDEPCP
jgi:hypothetical protein